MKIVLTGSHGFVGARLKKTIEDAQKKEDVSLLCVDRNDVNVYDYSDLGAYILDHVGPSFVIVHTAAMSDPKECEENQDEAYRANVVYTQNVAHICSDFNKPLIFLSSDQVYDFKNESEHREYDIPSPTNFYGKTKLWAERIIKDICPPHYIFRLSWQYDVIRNDVPNKGIISQIMKAVKTGEKIHQSKKSYRYVTWVNVTILFIMQAVAGRIPCGTYNLASVTNKSCYDLYKYTMEVLGINPKEYLKADNTLTPINLTAYPYALEALGSEITTYEETLINIFEDYKREHPELFKNNKRK
ncbi:MAG: sugar nucleotide-binding protein [Abditibacteriota bacterium]|nr:sugar nucleotide-binding protein [Abditibacteriota bacterium]